MKTIIQSILLLLASGIAIAETIYKSIDENGKVTYSTTPPQNTEKSTSINIAPAPSQEDIKAAQDRHERNKQAAGILDENRKKRDKINAEENRLKREKQKQLQQQRQTEKNNTNEDYIYIYVPNHRQGGTLPPVHKPVQLPAH